MNTYGNRTGALPIYFFTLKKQMCGEERVRNVVKTPNNNEEKRFAVMKPRVFKKPE